MATRHRCRRAKARPKRAPEENRQRLQNPPSWLSQRTNHHRISRCPTCLSQTVSTRPRPCSARKTGSRLQWSPCRRQLTGQLAPHSCLPSLSQRLSWYPRNMIKKAACMLYQAFDGIIVLITVFKKKSPTILVRCLRISSSRSTTFKGKRITKM